MRFPKLDLLIRDPAAHFSGGSIDALRDEAANSAQCGVRLVGQGVLTQEVIDQANRAVSLWVDALPVASRQSSDQRPGAVNMAK